MHYALKNTDKNYCILLIRKMQVMEQYFENAGKKSCQPRSLQPVKKKNLSNMKVKERLFHTNNS